MYEEQARQQLELQLHSPIKKYGLFIDNEYPFLGAPPDGLIGNDVIVEIKCPFSAFNTHRCCERKITFWRSDMSVNKNHSWYYQTQGQLRIKNRKKYVLAV